MKMKRTVRMPLRRAPQRTRPPASSLRARAATADEAYDDEEDYGGEEEPNMKLSHAFMVVLILHVIAVIGVFAFNSIKAGQSASAKSASKAPVESSVTKEPATAPATTAASTTTVTPSAPANLDGWKGKTHTVAAKETLTSIAAMNKTTVEAIEKENGITSYSVIRVGQVLKIPGTESAPVASAKEAATKQAFIATKTDTAKPAEDVIPLATTAKAAPVKAAPVPLVEPAAKAPVAPAPAVAAPAPASTSPAANGDVYVVAKGDNPYSIAKKLHVSYNDLIAVNEIKDATKIQIGQKLKIPAKKN